MKYLLDTNIIIYLYASQSPHHQKIVNHIAKGNSYFISVLTLFEMEYSQSNAPKAKQQSISDNIQSLKNRFSILPVVTKYAEMYGKMKAELKSFRNLDTEKMKKHNIDVMLASTAMIENYTLVSNGDIYPDICKKFSDFKYENWTL